MSHGAATPSPNLCLHLLLGRWQLTWDKASPFLPKVYALVSSSYFRLGGGGGGGGSCFFISKKESLELLKSQNTPLSETHVG